MADCPFITRVSRRSMLAGGAAVLLPGIGGLAGPGGEAAWGAPGDAACYASGAAEDEARIARLAARYRRASAALVDWVEAAERRHGTLAYERRPELRGRYRALAARDRRCTRALARARPGSLRGVVLKLRPAFYCEDLREAEADCDAEVLLAALGDLERLVGG